jgi:hypothetical protein
MPKRCRAEMRNVPMPIGYKLASSASLEFLLASSRSSGRSRRAGSSCERAQKNEQRCGASLAPNEEQSDIAGHATREIDHPGREPEALRTQFLLPAEVDLGGEAA